MLLMNVCCGSNSGKQCDILVTVPKTKSKIIFVAKISLQTSFILHVY